MELVRAGQSRLLRRNRVPIKFIIVGLTTLFFFVFVYDYRHRSLSNSLVPVYFSHHQQPEVIIETTATTDAGLLPGLDDCPSVSPKLIGRVKVKTRIPPINETHPIFKYVTVGGRYEPSECQSIYKVAIIVPYRERAQHLSTFLRHLHPFLQRQQIAYTIFLIEQCDRLAFNRGKLMNIGYVEARHAEDFDCFIFHDVDLVPEDDRNSYDCPRDGEPRQMVFFISINFYEKMGSTSFGGVTAMSTQDFTTVNGYSNLFWGWGGEDNDLYHRVISHNLTVTHPFPIKMARYTALNHQRAKPNPGRFLALNRSTELRPVDGLVDLNYRIIRMKLEPLYTHILVDLTDTR